MILKNGTHWLLKVTLSEKWLTNVNKCTLKSFLQKKSGGNFAAACFPLKRKTNSRVTWYKRFLNTRKRVFHWKKWLSCSAHLSFVWSGNWARKSEYSISQFGGFKFIETAHVKDVIAYLRVLENPRDVVSWNRILLLIDGVGPRTAEKVVDDILKRRVGLAKEFKEAVTANDEVLDGLRQLPGFCQKVIHHAQRHRRLCCSAVRKKHFTFFNIRTDSHARYEDHLKRKKDLDTFQNITRTLQVDRWIINRSCAWTGRNESIADIESPGPETEYLTLSTIHSAKGLEWTPCFIIYALEGDSRQCVLLQAMRNGRRTPLDVRCLHTRQKNILSSRIQWYIWRESGLILQNVAVHRRHVARIC